MYLSQEIQHSGKFFFTITDNLLLYCKNINLYSYFRYALGNSNINDDNFDKLDGDTVPDVILVKKFYGVDKAARRRARIWKLKHIADDIVSMSTDNKYVIFIINIKHKYIFIRTYFCFIFKSHF